MIGPLDFYDDGGKLLKRAAPSSEDIPSFVKTAGVVGQTSHPNQFALVLIDEHGRSLKKYATADRGNTWLSALYFGVTHGQLTKEAQQVAAAHLVQACEAYDIEPPVVALDLLPDSPPESNIVHLQGEAPAQKVKTASRKDYAITRADGSQHYPLDTAETVKAAQEYFGENAGKFTPRERHEYAVKTASVAEKHGLPLTEEIKKHASTKYSATVQGHLDLRYHHLVDAGEIEHANTLMKLAQARKARDPVQFASELEEFDKAVGFDQAWNRVVADPWYSTFGIDYGNGPDTGVQQFFVKTASGELYFDGERLQELIADGTIAEHFGKDVAESLRTEPEAVFESFPLPQKKLIAQLASGV